MKSILQIFEILMNSHYWFVHAWSSPLLVNHRPSKCVCLHQNSDDSFSQKFRFSKWNNNPKGLIMMEDEWICGSVKYNWVGNWFEAKNSYCVRREVHNTYTYTHCRTLFNKWPLKKAKFSLYLYLQKRQKMMNDCAKILPPFMLCTMELRKQTNIHAQ